MIVSAPSVPLEAVASNFATGLVGTIGVRVLDGQGGTATARSTSGVLETPASSGIYTATLTAPATSGQYVVVWDDGATFASEQLLVTYAGASVAAPTGYDLCTITDVKRDPTLTSVGTTHDDLIAETITQASLDFMLEAEREVVVTSGTNPQARTHVMAGYHRDREIPVGDLASTPTAVVIQDETGATVVTLTVGTDVEVLPRVRRAWEPITALRLRASAGVLASSYRLVVTGTYGWPAVPQDVRYAVRDTAVYRLRNHRALTNQSPDQFEDPSGPQRLFPASAMQVIRRYRAPVIGAG